MFLNIDMTCNLQYVRKVYKALQKCHISAGVGVFCDNTSEPEVAGDIMSLLIALS